MKNQINFNKIIQKLRKDLEINEKIISAWGKVELIDEENGVFTHLSSNDKYHIGVIINTEEKSFIEMISCYKYKRPMKSIYDKYDDSDIYFYKPKELMEEIKKHIKDICQENLKIQQEIKIIENKKEDVIRIAEEYDNLLSGLRSSVKREIGLEIAYSLN